MIGWKCPIHKIGVSPYCDVCPTCEKERLNNLRGTSATARDIVLKPYNPYEPHDSLTWPSTETSTSNFSYIFNQEKKK